MSMHPWKSVIASTTAAVSWILKPERRVTSVLLSLLSVSKGGSPLQNKCLCKYIRVDSLFQSGEFEEIFPPNFSANFSRKIFHKFFTQGLRPCFFIIDIPLQFQMFQPKSFSHSDLLPRGKIKMSCNQLCKTVL